MSTDATSKSRQRASIRAADKTESQDKVRPPHFIPPFLPPSLPPPSCRTQLQSDYESASDQSSATVRSNTWIYVDVFSVTPQVQNSSVVLKA